jgi:hypothetical protein
MLMKIKEEEETIFVVVVARCLLKLINFDLLQV